VRTIAIVEDDTDQRENYADALRSHGYEVETFANRSTAEARFQSNIPDLAILDIMLEDEMDGGFDLCRQLRTQSARLPIIFLTARDSDIDRVSGLRLDAWDSVRVNSLFRIVDAVATTEEKFEVLHLDDLVLDPNSMSVVWKDQSVNLTLTEFWLIQSLAKRPGHVKTYDALMQVTRQSYVEKNTINGYVRRVRKKFKSIDPEFDMIQTVFGIGYRWKADS